MSKANKDGWIRHRGGKCPVGAGVLIDIRCRDGNFRFGVKCGKPQTRTAPQFWSHDGDGAEVMAYRIHKPAEQADPVSEPADTSIANNSEAVTVYQSLVGSIKSLGAELRASGELDPILTIRDRIRELDTLRAEVEATYQRQIGEIGKERGELVGKLAAEDLALVDVPAQPVETDFDAEDESTWRVGDEVEIEHSDNDFWLTRKGMRGQLNYDSTRHNDGWYISFVGPAKWYVSDNTKIKLISRPSS